MKIKVFRNIIAFMLVGLALFQAIFVLVPEEEKVLCLADDHIAIEIPDAMSPAHARSARSGMLPAAGYFLSDRFVSYPRSFSGTCSCYRSRIVYS